ncbi:MAG: glycosyltransferase family 1 protein [Hyphomicrobiales bacterium]|nr:glycosyltransferase family 1 protein [Hyphomicrobiales bacterium]
MSDRRLAFLDLTDVVDAFLKEGAAGGIPRVVFTVLAQGDPGWRVQAVLIDWPGERIFIFRNDFASSFEHLHFLWQAGHRSGAADLVRQRPDLFVEMPLRARPDVPMLYLSCLWTSLRGADAEITTKLRIRPCVLLHHDSYIMERAGCERAAFEQFWTCVVKADCPTVFISDHMRDAFSDHFGLPNQHATAPFDLHFDYSSGEVSATVAALLGESDQPFVFMPCLFDGRKNPAEVIAALRRPDVLPDHRRILSIRITDYDVAVLDMLCELNSDPRFELLRWIPDPDYICLIRHAAAVIYPSRREGFGILPVDCARFGKPCYILDAADFGYLHPNVRTLDLASCTLGIVERDVDARALKARSRFVRTLFKALEHQS